MFKLYNNANSTNSKDFVLELKQNNEPKYQLNIKINSENKQLNKVKSMYLPIKFVNFRGHLFFNH